MKSTFIDKIIKEYQTIFSVDWIETLDWTDKSKSQISYKYGIQLIDKFSESFFVALSKSVISGEYLVRENLLQDLKDFSSLVENDYPPINTPLLKNKLYREYQRLDDNILITINGYRQLIYTVNNKVSQEYHKLLVNAFATNGKKVTNAHFHALHTYVFNIYAMDHMLSYDKGDIQTIILIKEELTNSEPKQSALISPIYRLLKDKCSFLIKKLVFFDGTAEYSINFETKIIDKGSISAEYLQDFDKYFNFFHKHQYTGVEPLVYEWENNCLQKKAKLGQMILLMKYYKDHKDTTEPQVRNLISEFDHVYAKILPRFSNRKFDVYALNTLKNYMYNCRLSFRMKHNYTYEKLCADMLQIEQIQRATHIKNFYPFKKAIAFLINDIRNDFNNTTYSEDVLTQKYKVLDDYIQKFEIAIHWCKEQRFYPVQLLYNECLKKDNDSGLIVFMPSSFSRPINYNKLEDELQQYKSEFGLIKGELSLQREKAKIEFLKHEIDSSKKSNIEILGLFTAVITFLFGCVNIFSGSNNAKFSISEHILHITCLGLILLLFVSAIYVLTIRREEKFRDYFSHPRFILFGLSIIGYIIILTLVVYRTTPPSSSVETANILQKQSGVTIQE